MTCIICGWRKATGNQRCDSCRGFLRHHGRDRTVPEVMAHYQRFIEKLFPDPEPEVQIAEPFRKRTVPLDELPAVIAALQLQRSEIQ